MPHEPDWWHAPAHAWQAALLAPAGALYGLGAKARWSLRTPTRAAVPVVCVGNFTGGGAGKTPTAIAVAHAVQGLGARPAFLTRGYGGRERGPYTVDPNRDGPQRVGDEALLLARIAPTIVAVDRVAGAGHAVRHGASVVVMDDGFQNPALHKDLALVAVDAGRGVGNGRVMPAGPLRAPLPFQLAKADALVVIGEGLAADPLAQAMAARQRPVLRGRLVPTGDTDWAAGARVIAFAGIGRPQKFFATLEELGATLVRRIAFPDHHRFTSTEAKDLLAQARDAAAILVTTEKDWARLANGAPFLDELKAAVRPLPIALKVDDRDGFVALLASALALRPSARPSV